MRTISVTEAKKELTQLAADGQSFQLTSHGQEVATFRVFVQPKFDPVKARVAFEKFKTAAKRIQPSKRNGATKSVRELRDGIDA